LGRKEAAGREWSRPLDHPRRVEGSSAWSVALIRAIDVLSERAAVKAGRDARWQGNDTLKRIRKKT
jgi:hypothetical protein